MSSDPRPEWALILDDGDVVIEVRDGTFSRFINLGPLEAAGARLAAFLADAGLADAGFKLNRSE